MRKFHVFTAICRLLHRSPRVRWSSTAGCAPRGVHAGRRMDHELVDRMRVKFLKALDEAKNASLEKNIS